MADEKTARLSDAERRLIVGICLVFSALTVLTASYNYILEPMLEGLHASETQSAMLRQLPSIAGLLVVFLAGALGDRFGDRKMLVISSVLFSAGTALVAVAPALPVASLGLVIQSIGGSIAGVVGLGLLSRDISDPQNRASAFSILAIVSPLIYIAVPVASGVLVDSLSWRYVAWLWVVSGFVMLWASLRLLPADTDLRGSDELLTPVIAGVVLAAGVQLVNSLADSGLTSTDSLIRIAVVIVGLVWLVALFRRPKKRSLSLAALRSGGMLVLLVVVLLVPFTYIWYYATMGFQYVFGLTVLETAIALIPGQLGGVLGAIVTRKILQKRGVRSTGVIALFAFAASLLTLWFIQTDSPLWVPMIVFALYGFTLTAVGIPVTNAIMNTAPKGEEGSASAFRSASARIGAAIGVLFTTTILVTVATQSLTNQLSQQGGDDSQSKQIVESLVNGATSEEVASQYSIPVQQVQSIDADLAHALVDGIHFVSIAGALVALICVVFFILGLRAENLPAQEAA